MNLSSKNGSSNHAGLDVTVDAPLSTAQPSPALWLTSSERSPSESAAEVEASTMAFAQSSASSSTSSEGASAAKPFGASDPDGYAGVHNVLKRVDVWFEIEAAGVEKQAAEYAERWAVANLPTPGDKTEEPIDPEKVLAKRAGELWQGWAHRVRVKLQDSLDSAADDMSRHVASARTALTEYRIAREALGETERKIEDIKRVVAEERPRISYAKLLPEWAFWLLAVALVSVEFVANQPVFRIVWPMPANVSNAIAETVEDTLASGRWAGLRYTLLELVSYVEASLLALVVVILLFVLGKELGSACRPLLALRSDDYPYAKRSIEALHRQKMLLAAVSALGTAAILFFLWSARATAPDVAGERLAATVAREQSVTAELNAAQANGDLSLITSVQTRLLDIGAERIQQEEVHAFARSIGKNSIGILVLNLSFVCCAFVVGFMSDSRDLTESVGEHPDLPGLRDKCHRMRADARRLADAAKEQTRLGELAGARVRSLLRTRPMSSQEAKRARLESVIPAWRAENARLRRLDPSMIAAFRFKPDLHLPSLDETLALAEPEQFADTQSALRTVAAEVDGVVLRDSSHLEKELAA